MQDKIFFDSNLWLYLFAHGKTSDDINKGNTVKGLLRQSPNLYSSAQVFNEVANVLQKKKFKFSEADTLKILQEIDQLSHCIPLTKDISYKALALKARYQLSWFDSLIVAAALEAECNLLYTEDLHDGLIIEQTLTVKNPFTP